MPKKRKRKNGGHGYRNMRKKRDQIGDSGDSIPMKDAWAYFNTRKENYQRDPYSNRSLSASITLDSLSCSHLRMLDDFDYKNGYIYDRKGVKRLLIKPTWEIGSQNALEKDCLKNRLLMLKHDEQSPLGQPSWRNHINKLIKSGRHKDGILNERYRGLRPLDEEWIMESYAAYVNWCMDNINEVLDDIYDSKNIKRKLNEGTGSSNWLGIADQYIADLITEKVFMTQSRAIWKIAKTRSKIIGSNESDWADCYYNKRDKEKDWMFPVLPFLFKGDLPDNWFDICFSRRSAYIVEHEDKELPSFSITKLSEKDDDVKRFGQLFGEHQKEALLGLGKLIGSGTCFSQQEKKDYLSKENNGVLMNQHHALPLIHPSLSTDVGSMYWDVDEAKQSADEDEMKRIFKKRQFLWNASIIKQREGHSDRGEVMRFTFFREKMTKDKVTQCQWKQFGLCENEWTMFPSHFDITVTRDLAISHNGDFTVLEDMIDRGNFLIIRDSLIGLVLDTIKNLVRINQETVEWVKGENKEREEKKSKGEAAPPLSDEEIEAYEAKNISVPNHKKKYYYDEEDGKVKRKEYNKGSGETPMPHIRIRKHERFKSGKLKNRWGFYKPEDFPVPVNIRPEGENCTWETVSVGDKDMDSVLEARAEHLIKTGKRVHEILIDDDPKSGSGLLNKMKKTIEVIDQKLSNLKPEKTQTEFEVKAEAGSLDEPKPWWKFWKR
jgi:hypothetical protein